MLEPLSVLHEHIRLSHDSWPCAGGCDRTETDTSGPGSLGGDWRRRRVEHRRKSYDSHAPPERWAEGAVVQQQNLWLDQGTIFADFGNWEEDEIHSLWHGGPSIQSGFFGNRIGSDVCSADRGCVHAAHEGHPEIRSRAQRRR